MNGALGLIETIGLSTAVAALDAATDTADVKLAGYEKIIGAGGSVSVTIHIVGDVAAVKAAVDAGVVAAERAGRVLAARVIPRPHEDVQKLVEEFKKNKGKNKLSKPKSKEK